MTAAVPTRFADVPDLLAGLRRFPADRPALTFYQGRSRVGRLGYGELLAAIDRFTIRLRDQLGIAAGDRSRSCRPTGSRCRRCSWRRCGSVRWSSR